jgi:hypothetical protein
MRSTILVLLVLAMSVPVRAQRINIDVGSNTTYPVPSSVYGAAAGQPGTWNSVAPVGGTTNLVDLAGAATTVSIASTGGSAFESNMNPGPTGDDLNLMADVSDPSFTGQTWTISGLAAGNYLLYTYSWPPDNPVFRSVISVAGSVDGPQTTGGSWPLSGQTLGITYALHHVSVPPGGSIAMTITVAGGGSYASLNGFQIAPDSAASPGVDLCQPGVGGVIGCPCGNPPANAPRGCDNSSATGGARLVSIGVASLAADTVVFTTDGEKPSATSIVVQGNNVAASGLSFGQGVRCFAGALKRLYVKAASGGSITAPQPGDPSVSVRSAALGDTITASSSRWYGVYYRDPIVLGGCSPTRTFNSTQTQQILWAQ